MTKETLDRMTLCNLENEEVLEKKGKASFKLHLNQHYAAYDKSKIINNYYIIGKVSGEGVVFDQSISQTTKIGREEFLKEVNDDLAQMNSYLSQAEYSNGFPVFGLPSVKGVLYKKKEKKVSGNYLGEKG